MMYVAVIGKLRPMMNDVISARNSARITDPPLSDMIMVEIFEAQARERKDAHDESRRSQQPPRPQHIFRALNRRGDNLFGQEPLVAILAQKAVAIVATQRANRRHLGREVPSHQQRNQHRKRDQVIAFGQTSPA